MLENAAFCEQALAEAAPLLNEPPLGPSRDQLLAAVA
jgi:hypothetical protein